MRDLKVSIDDEGLKVFKALSNEQRLNILRALNHGPLNVNEISEKLKLPFSTTAVNIQKLQDSGIITTEIIPGHGNQKVSSKKYDNIIVNLSPVEPANQEDHYIIDLPIGDYVDCQVEPTCGLADENGYIGPLDNPRIFFEPNKRHAQLLWFRKGYIEYRFPNRLPLNAVIKELVISTEACSEAPYHREDWPSDITIWVNNIEIGTWTCLSDFGGERGLYTPVWRKTSSTQYGELKYWKVEQSGSYLDNKKISNITLKDLSLESLPYFPVGIGVKENAKNAGGLNLFGQKFGNYKQGLVMKVSYHTK